MHSKKAATLTTVPRASGVTWGVTWRAAHIRRALGLVGAGLAVAAGGGTAGASPIPGTTYDPVLVATSMWQTTQVVDASDNAWANGFTGKGVDVALVDTGVTPVQGLDAPGKILDGPDFSFDSQDPARTRRDFYGHGTHLAGIIAGNDAPGVFPTDYAAQPDTFRGVAPDARILNVKVGDSHGVVDVSQVIAAITWITQHRADPGVNVKVIVLAYASDATQDQSTDPLDYAIEQAWRKGIVVVVSAGNTGADVKGLTGPAMAKTPIVVGASDPNGTNDPADDRVAAFSTRGRGGLTRSPDLVAPGLSIASLRVPGSALDAAHCQTACLGSRFFKGSGTSQAAAVVGGLAAIVLQKYPTATPDQVKAFLKRGATLVGENSTTSGAGRVDLDTAFPLGLPALATSAQTYTAKGTGTLDASRGSRRATMGGRAIAGEIDIFGRPYASGSMATAIAAGRSWSGGTWNGSTWTGSTWSGSTWSGSTWSGSTWSGSTWSGSSWSGSSWSGSSWSGDSWQGALWSQAKLKKLSKADLRRYRRHVAAMKAGRVPADNWGSTWS